MSPRKKIDRFLANFEIPRAHLAAYWALFVADRDAQSPARWPAWRDPKRRWQGTGGMIREYDGVPPCASCNAHVAAMDQLHSASNRERRATGWSTGSWGVKAKCPTCGLWWRSLRPEHEGASKHAVRYPDWMTEKGPNGVARFQEPHLADHLAWDTGAQFRVAALRWAPLVQWCVWDFDFKRVLTSDERKELQRRLQVAPDRVHLEEFVIDLAAKRDLLKAAVRRLVNALPVRPLAFSSSPGGGVHLYMPLSFTDRESAHWFARRVAETYLPEAFERSLTEKVGDDLLDRCVHPHASQSLRLPLGLGSKLLDLDSLEPMFLGDTAREQVPPALAWLAAYAKVMPRLWPMNHPQFCPPWMLATPLPTPSSAAIISLPFRLPAEARQRRPGPPSFAPVLPEEFTERRWYRLLDRSPNLRALVDDVQADDRSRRDCLIVGALGRLGVLGKPGAADYGRLAHHVLVTYVPNSKARERGEAYTMETIVRPQEAWLLEKQARWKENQRQPQSGQGSMGNNQRIGSSDVVDRESSSGASVRAHVRVAGWEEFVEGGRRHGVEAGVRWIRSEVSERLRRTTMFFAVSEYQARGWLEGVSIPDPETQGLIVEAAKGLPGPTPQRRRRAPEGMIVPKRDRGRPRNKSTMSIAQLRAYVLRRGRAEVARIAGRDQRTIDDYLAGVRAIPEDVARKLREVDPLPVERRPLSAAKRRQRRRRRGSVNKRRR